MSEVFKWRVWCSTDSKFVYGWAETEPTNCFENIGHSIDTSKTASIRTLREEVQTYPKGSGVRFRSMCFTDTHEPFEVACAEGKKLVMMISKCVFDEKIVDLPHIVFEVLAYIGGQWVIVDQDYYKDLADLIVDADEKAETPDGVWTLNFNWPTLDNPLRDSTVLSYGTKVKVYMTTDAEHAPGPLTAYTPITEGQKPTWPDPPPAVELAHVCFHCIAYNEDEI